MNRLIYKKEGVMNQKIYDNYVFAVAKHGSLTKAAASLGVSQPALSSGINALERDLGFRIFDRQVSPICFTQEGNIYYDYLQKVQILTKDLDKRIRCVTDRANQRVTIGAPVAYAQSLVAEAVHKLLQENPNFYVSVKSAPLAELIQMTSDGEIDCFVSTSSQLPDNLVIQEIRKEKVYLCVPKAYLINEQLSRVGLSNVEKFDYSILDQQSFIFLENTQPLQQSVDEFLKAHKVQPVSHITVNQVSTALRFAAKGEGICFATDEALAGNVDAKQVKAYDLPKALSGREIFVAYDKNLITTDACKKLIQFLISGELLVLERTL